MTHWTRVFAGGSVAATVAIAAYLGWSFSGALDPAPSVGTVAAPGSADTPAIADTTTSETATKAKAQATPSDLDIPSDAAAASQTPETSETALADTAAPTEAAPALTPPTFDLVRIEPDGAALVAGQGAAGAEVTVYLDANAVARTTAGRDGKFASLMEIAPSPQPRVMTLAMRSGEDEVFADAEIIVAPFGPKPETDTPAEVVTGESAAPDAPSDPTRALTDAGQTQEPGATDTGAEGDVAIAALNDAAVAEEASSDVETGTERQVAALSDTAPEQGAAGLDISSAAQDQPAAITAPEIADKAASNSAAPATTADSAGAGTARGATDPASDAPAGDTVVAATEQPAPTKTQTAETQETKATGSEEVLVTSNVARAPTVAAQTAGIEAADQVSGGTETDQTGSPTASQPADARPQTAEASDADQPAAQASDRAEATTASISTATAPEDTANPDSATPASVPARTDPAPAAPKPTLLASDKDGVRVLAGPEVLDRVAIDTISYDDAGDVALAGRGVSISGGGFVRVYLDNTPITTSRIRSDGSWQVDLPEVDKGVYTLRVDEVDANGAVKSRAETPFKREDRATLERVSDGALGTGPVKIVTVQPGNTLWQIARDRYGEGLLYVRVFQANSGQIRNPDLIYPGQVFDLPEEADAATD